MVKIVGVLNIALLGGVVKISNEYKDWLKDHELEIKEFVEKYCQWCGTQRCEGPDTK